MTQHRTPFGDSPGTYVLFWAFWAAFLLWPLYLPGLATKVIVEIAWVALLGTGLVRKFYRRGLERERERQKHLDGERR